MRLSSPLGVRIPVTSPRPRPLTFQPLYPNTASRGQHCISERQRTTGELKQEPEALVPTLWFHKLPRGKSPCFPLPPKSGKPKPVGSDSAASVVRKAALFPHREENMRKTRLSHRTDAKTHSQRHTHAHVRATLPLPLSGFSSHAILSLFCKSWFPVEGMLGIRE